jgi:anti-sigma factor ChrR (cupin superfamily)
MQARTLSLALLLVGATGALADDMKMPVNASQLEWAPAPNFVPEGAQIAVLSGDPSKDGPYVLRMKMPAGYKVPAHNHPTTEMVTVISGDFHLGMGDKLDQEKGMLLTAGGYAEASAKMNHYAWAGSPTIVQIHGQGPFAITYVNPDDDPRSKPQTSK